MPTAPSPRTERTRTILRLLLAAAYLAAGILHLYIPAPFLRITPAWVPVPTTVIAFTGVCEIAGAVALFVPRLRWWAGVMLAAYAVCVYPANVKHAIDQVLVAGETHSLWYHAPRLLFQPVIVWWALFAGCVTDWPFGRASATGTPPKLMPESKWIVAVTEQSIDVTDDKSVVRSVRKADLSGVVIETNDSGPWGADLWWLFFADDTLAAIFPQGATGEAEVLTYLLKLPSFDHEQMVTAMASTDNRTFPVWRRAEASARPGA